MQKFLIKIISCFILNKNKRKKFRNKYLSAVKQADPMMELSLRMERIEKGLLYSMPQAKGRLRELQLSAYKLLALLREICEKNNLTFWIQGGTLLGAVRHQGFIPWDDDIDCGMPRVDLCKLKELLKDYDSIEYIECYNIVLHNGFACRMPKIRFKNDHNIFVDIFPYDFINIKDEDEKNEWKNFYIQREKLTKEILELGVDSPDIPMEDENKRKKIENIIEKYLPTKISLENATHIIWGIENLPTKFCRLYKIDDFFPTQFILFENNIYPAPKKYGAYLKRQYKDIWKLPKDMGSLSHFIYTINIQHIKNLRDDKKIIGYTAGAFDLFHIGHLNLLKNAKSKCDYLIVGVTTDDLIERTKGKRPFIPLSERMDIVRGCKYVDEVVVQDDLDKFEAWKIYKYDILFSGSDWQTSPRWQEYERKLKDVGSSLYYFPYTKSTSSSKIQKLINENERD